MRLPGTSGGMNDSNNHKKSSLIVILKIGISPEFEPNPLIVSNHKNALFFLFCFGFFRTSLERKTCLIDDHTV